MSFKSYKQESKTNWGCEGRKPNRDDLQFGAILRIADAVETMARPFVSLLEEVEYQKKRRASLEEGNARLYRRMAALRGHITRLKSKK